MKRPTKCAKCQSKKITIWYCAGAPVDHRGVGARVTHGFVCETPREHFHYTCSECGYKETKAVK
jgi:hypothetical protein